jgi:hypothetical protein
LIGDLLVASWHCAEGGRAGAAGVTIDGDPRLHPIDAAPRKTPVEPYVCVRDVTVGFDDDERLTHEAIRAYSSRGR